MTKVSMRPFTLEEWLRLVLAANEIRDKFDKELGSLVLVAAQEDTIEAWGAVHDRLNVLGNFEEADQVRRIFKRA